MREMKTSSQQQMAVRVEEGAVKIEVIVEIRGGRGEDRKDSRGGGEDR